MFFWYKQKNWILLKFQTFDNNMWKCNLRKLNLLWTKVIVYGSTLVPSQFPSLSNCKSSVWHDTALKPSVINIRMKVWCASYVTLCCSLQHDTRYLVKPKGSCHQHQSLVFHIFSYGALSSSAVTLETDAMDSMRTPVITSAFNCSCVCRLDPVFSSLNCC